jgi:hypothetical protein
MCETGTGQQVVQLLDNYMMMMVTMKHKKCDRKYTVKKVKLKTIGGIPMRLLNKC